MLFYKKKYLFFFFFLVLKFLLYLFFLGSFSFGANSTGLNRVIVICAIDVHYF